MTGKKTFFDKYQDSKDKEQLRKEAFQYFNDKYFKKPFEPYWIFEQDDRMRAKRLKFFIPGRVYTFQYTPHGKDILTYYDKRPMVFIIGEYISQSSGYSIVQGINLNFLPESVKANFISTAMDVFNKGYEKADQESDKGKLYTMNNIANFITNWFFMAANFDKRGKIGLQFATRNYDLAMIKNPVLIELEDFEMIPYFVPKELQGKSPAFVYQLYLKSRNEIIKNSNEKNRNDKKAKNLQKRYKKPGGA